MGGARASRVVGALCIAAATVVGAIVLGGGKAATAATETAPPPGVHLGVASCAGSTCHSRQVDSGVNIRQNELITWQDPGVAGAHSRAWTVLRTTRSQAIARKLGIGDPASAKECIECHSDTVAASAGKHQISDGVGCESCHGGSSGWLDSHRTVAGGRRDVPAGTSQAVAAHQANLERGLKRLEDPKVRADVCLDCHYGSSRRYQFVTHDIMAAGHPRVAFELDLFSSLQKHWDVDRDYVARKVYADGAKTWAVGQAMAVKRAASLYASGARNMGAFPELYFFDCHACHREISDDPSARPKWEVNPGRFRTAGQPPFNDENMIMVSAAAKVLAPGLAARFDAETKAFHDATTRSGQDSRQAAARLAATADQLANVFAARGEVSPGQAHAILDAVLAGEITRRYTDYAGSAQAVMAAETLVNHLVARGADRGVVDRAIRPSLNAAYAQVREPNSYRPEAFRASLTRVAQAARSLR
ncbi:multiheme c-type cytochrome [Phenylobacterium kunshanense]|uniref:Cytochrome c-552/4 domain-containing protein n=1 Tax=Phenylobacterium kunshanense TaxID=1445034 RepID=A0A328BRT0_9CAUL|nr:multiheme c-type cytochrome [Phenylobacterium kunshanense]RAK68554.1 hypothetical protein DJ019_00560 [Phenylobacterium kunshanense]